MDESPDYTKLADAWSADHAASAHLVRRMRGWAQGQAEQLVEDIKEAGHRVLSEDECLDWLDAREEAMLAKSRGQ
jgi:hypothetical protein